MNGIRSTRAEPWTRSRSSDSLFRGRAAGYETMLSRHSLGNTRGYFPRYVWESVVAAERIRFFNQHQGPGFVTIHQGGYDTIGQAYSALLAWIEANGYGIVGASREVYLRCPDNDYTDPNAIGYAEYTADDPAAFVTEVQFPVAKA